MKSEIRKLKAEKSPKAENRWGERASLVSVCRSQVSPMGRRGQSRRDAMSIARNQTNVTSPGGAKCVESGVVQLRTFTAYEHHSLHPRPGAAPREEDLPRGIPTVSETVQRRVRPEVPIRLRRGGFDVNSRWSGANGQARRAVMFMASKPQNEGKPQRSAIDPHAVDGVGRSRCLAGGQHPAPTELGSSGMRLAINIVPLTGLDAGCAGIKPHRPRRFLCQLTL
jgi:hypothetical protein